MKKTLISFCICLLAAVSCTGNDEGESSSSTPYIRALDSENRISSTTVVIPDPPSEGTLVGLSNQSPLSLHAADPANSGVSIVQWVQEGLIEGLFGVSNSVTYYPELLASEPDVTKNESGTVTIRYTLRDGLEWSDGEPLTSDDVAYTHKIITEECSKEGDGSIIDGTTNLCVYKMGSRRGYDLITDFTVTSETEFSITLAGVYPNWKALYPRVLAEHAYGADAETVNTRLATFSNGDTPLPSSGPLVFKEWIQGSKIELGSNKSYHGSQSPDGAEKGSPKINNFEITFLPNAKSLEEALIAGAGHFIITDPSVAFAEVAGAENVTAAASGGSLYEHLSMNLVNPHLDKPDVRKALAYALDKEQIVADLYSPLYGEDLPKEGLGNSYWVPQQPFYADNQKEFNAINREASRQSLLDADYVRGEDGIYTHPEDGRLSLRFVTTENDPFREGQQEIIAAQLAEAGIETEILNLPANEFFETRNNSKGPFANQNAWDLTIFSWVGGPWPGAQTSAYGGKSASNNVNNIYDFNSPDFDNAAKKCELLLDLTDSGSDEGECYRELDKFATALDDEGDGLFIIPISQKPSFYAYRSDLISSAIVADSDHGGPFVNAADYAFK